MILSNRGRTVHYFSRLFAYSLGPPSPRYYVPYGMKFSRLFFHDPPKFDHVKLNSRKSIDTEVYYFFYMNGSPQVAIFYLHFFTMTKSLRRHHLLLDRYHRKNLFGATLNATNLWSAKMKTLRKFQIMWYTFIVQNSNLTILHVVCKTFWAVLYHLSLKISKFLSSLGFSACNVLLFACSNKKINWVLRVI